MGKIPLEKSPYSYHFKMLTLLGVWVFQTRNPFVKNSCICYETTVMVVCFFICCLLYMDLYFVFGDVKKMTWNLCVSVLFTGWFMKHFITYRNINVINRLRRRFHRQATTAMTPEDEQLNKTSARYMKFIETLAQLGMVVFIPVWLMTFYFGLMWGERDIPIPLWLPFEVDFRDDLQFNLVFAATAVLGILVMIFVMTVEMAMYTILIQLSREYERLAKDFRRINELYEDCVEGGVVAAADQEVNPYLREIKTKRLLRELTIRQQNLIQYTRDFEETYRYPLLLQFFFTSGSITVCAVQCLLDDHIISFNLIYEIGYISAIVIDVFFLCWLVSRIRTQCYNVGEAAYSVLWYRMGIDVQKSICMIIRRSQHPPKITCGKIIEMDLHTFMIMMRNIYSWLTLFQKLAFKSMNK